VTDHLVKSVEGDHALLVWMQAGHGKGKSDTIIQYCNTCCNTVELSNCVIDLCLRLSSSSIFLCHECVDDPSLGTGGLDLSITTK